MLSTLLVACASTSDPMPGPSRSTPSTSARPTPQAQAPTPSPSPTPSALPPGSSCAQHIAHYREVRGAENHCERDSDCAEIYPGPCSEGPYYTHLDSDHTATRTAERAMADACEQGPCEMPMPLGIAHCETGRCRAGRTPPPEGPNKSCWDTRVTYMLTTFPYVATSSEHLQGITPLYAVGVGQAGTLRISADLGCTDCRLMVSEHNPGMSRLITGKPFTPTPVEPGEIRPSTSQSPPVLATTHHLEFPVEPGPYFIATVGGAPAGVQYEVSLLDAKGASMQPNRVGVVHLRTCEG